MACHQATAISPRPPIYDALAAGTDADALEEFAFLMHQAMRIFQREGIPRVSLCLIPGLRCQTPLPGDSTLARWGLVAGTRYFGLVFDTAGAYHFKTRFRPYFENRYLCMHPKMTIGSSWALIRLLGVLRLDAAKLVRLFAARWKKRASRATLRLPDVHQWQRNHRNASHLISPCQSTKSRSAFSTPTR